MYGFILNHKLISSLGGVHNRHPAKTIIKTDVVYSDLHTAEGWRWMASANIMHESWYIVYIEIKQQKADLNSLAYERGICSAYYAILEDLMVWLEMEILLFTFFIHKLWNDPCYHPILSP